MPLPTRSTIDRFGIAARNLLEGNVESTARALFDPVSLAPSEAKTLAEEWGVDKGPLGFIWRSMTNPLVLAGLIMGMRYPVVKADKMFQFAKKVGGYEAKMAPWLAKIRSPHAVYAGTQIPDALTGLIRSVDDFKGRHGLALGEILGEWETRTGKVMGPREQVLLAAKLDGLDQGKGAILQKIGLDSITQSAQDRLRNFFDKTHDEVFELVDGKWKVRGGYGGFTGVEPPSKIEHYFPHTMPRVQKEFQGLAEAYLRRSEELLAQGGQEMSKREVYLRKQLAGAEKGAVFTRGRKWHSIPDPDDLELIRDQLRPGVVEEFRDILRKNPGLNTYSLRLTPVVSEYVHKMAPTYAWSVKGHGTPILEDLARFKDRTDIAFNPVRAKLLEDKYIPVALGKLTHDQAVASQAWASRMYDAFNTLKDSRVAQVLGPNLTGKLQKMLFADKGPFSLTNISGNLASWFYTAALGANPGSATLNLMQTVLTTYPVLGAKDTANGIKSVWKNAEKYFTGRFAQKLGHEEAIRKAWPEFAKAGISANPVLDEVVQNSLQNAYGLAGVGSKSGRYGKALDSVQRALMSFFTASENTVRLVAFEGARGKALREGLGSEAATAFGRQVTEITQFLSGPSNAPALLIDKNPLLKQFASFPLRGLEFATYWSTALGSGDKAGMLGRNWGTLGRMMASTGIAHEAGKSLGMDLEGGLWPGVFPLAPDRAPFSPLPLPPILTIMGGAVQDIRHGEFENLPYSLPLLVPGGIALSRAASVVAPLVAPDATRQVQQVLNKEYVDYRQKTPDGNYAVFSGSGNLVGYFSPMDLFLKATGIGGGGRDAQQARELTSYFTAQRDRIRGYRRQYLEALVNNDPQGAREIESAYEQAYPGMGGLQIKKTDIRAVQLRREVPILERTLDTLPEEVRPAFAEMLQTALLSEGSGLLGIDPSLLGQVPSAAKRLPLRSAVTQPGSYGALMSPIRSEPGQLQPRDYKLPQAQAFESF